MGERELEAFWAPKMEIGCAGMIADRFWQSLPSMTRDVDLVVVGRPIAVGERQDSWSLMRPFTVLEIAIDEVIRGIPETREDGHIDVELYYGPQLDVSGGLPANRHLFFLGSIAAAKQEDGATVADNDRHSYKLPSIYQNVLIEADGQVFVPAADQIAASGGNTFPVSLQGRSFEDVLSVVRRAAGRDGAANRAGAAMLFAC